MAALLRSARLLKINPCPLLQVKGTCRYAATFSSVCSRGVCWRAAAAAAGGGPCGLSSYSSVWTCSALRYYSTAPEHVGETVDYSSLILRNKQAQQFDWALAKLDSSVRRTGRVTRTLLQRIFQDVCRAGCPSGNQALLMLRSCGSLLPELPCAERTEFAHHIWDRLQELGATYDVSHYNALLKVYLQNDFKMSPTDFLAKMEEANVQPNRVTYQRLIALYCQSGDLDGASEILTFMKSKDLPITEAVFSSLVMGHSRAGDMESAENILSVMSGAGIEPGPTTYTALLCAYAEQGNFAKVKEVLDNLENIDKRLQDRDLMEVVSSLAKAGLQQHVPEMIQRMRQERGYIPDAMNLSLNLITQGFVNTAYSVLKTFSIEEPTHNGDIDLGCFFLRHCVNMNKSTEELVSFCRDMKDSNLHSAPLHFVLYCALETKKTALAVELMKVIKNEGFPIRPHYFWPLLVQHKNNKDTAGAVEVLKAMSELGVVPGVETFSNFVLSTFPSVDHARDAVKDAGCAVDKYFDLAAIRHQARLDLPGTLAIMSSPSFQITDFNAFRGSLLLGFKQFSDVETMAKITEILYKDKKLCQAGKDKQEQVGYFLYHLFELMTASDVQAKTQEIKEYFKNLAGKKIKIPGKLYKGIKKLALTYNVPELIEDVLALVDKQTSGEVAFSSMENTVITRKTFENLRSNGKPGDFYFRQLINSLCAEENLSSALELQSQYPELMVPSSYAMLIGLCCRLSKVDEAMKLKTEMFSRYTEVTLDTQKYMGLVRLLSLHGRVEEAVDLLKEIKEKNMELNENALTMMFHTLGAAGKKGDVTTIRRLQDTCFTLGLFKPSANLCSPYVIAYLESGDLAKALEACEECQKLYNSMPRIHDLVCALIENGDTDLLQKAMDFVSRHQGENSMLYELSFGFLKTGRYKEARKIFETPGLRARPGKLQWFAEKCIAGKQMETLENFVDVTEKLFECDRDEMYHYLLRLCVNTNNWCKAEATWTKMQEENVIPRERTLRLLADVFKNNNQEVPFDVPEVWYEQPEAIENSSEEQPKDTALEVMEKQEVQFAQFKHKLISLTKKGKVQDAYNILKKAEEQNMSLDSALYNLLIKALLAKGKLNEAMTVRDIAVARLPEFQLSEMARNLKIVTQAKQGLLKDAVADLKEMLEKNLMPSQLAISRLVKGMSNKGDIEGIQEVWDMMKPFDQHIKQYEIMYVNHIALALINNGDIMAAVEGLESLFSQGKKFSNKSIFVLFNKLFNANNQEALDALSALVERLYHHFSMPLPATNLFLAYLDTNNTEEAKLMLQRCAGIAEQKAALMSFVARSSKTPGQFSKIKTLSELIPDFVDKVTLYSYLMKCHAVDNDLSAAKALYQQAQADGLEVDELFLKRLALLYKKSGEDPPFVEPAESFGFYAMKIKNSKTQSDADD
ncbi:leucine-rich PPR motif-containing protein, mitochondrial [Salminus brasiliensis]|uniref:leucine-rich PPR motif-containing protein, mitochondrial n=1 Tax=Salminus brasiliensis TaxID=930266 RepID=UPI003B82DBA5